MSNQTLGQWVLNTKNFEDNLKIVMWNQTKVPVSNLMCPICNKKKDLDMLRALTMNDPELLNEETQEVLHKLKGWHDVKLAIYHNVVYHKECLKAKLKKKFGKELKKGLILCE